jgi:hypothetical protein
MTTNRIARSTAPAVNAKVGDIVSYEDMSNPAAFFTVIGFVKDAWGTEAQLVSHSSGRITTCAMRGAGWVMAEVAA